MGIDYSQIEARAPQFGLIVEHCQFALGLRFEQDRIGPGDNRKGFVSRRRWRNHMPMGQGIDDLQEAVRLMR